MWIHKQNAMRMPANQNTNMHLYEKKLISVYRSKALELMFLIGIVSWSPWQANGVIIWPWKALKPSFQFSTFFRKFKFLLWLFCAAGTLFALGLHYVFMCEWFRSKKPNKNLCIHDFQDLILKDLFKYFFMKNHHNLHQFFPLLIGTKSLVNHE